MHDMNKMQKEGKPNHGGNIISHSRKWQELELQLWQVTSGVLHVLRYATPLPMNRTPVSTVALQHKSVSSVLRYATPLRINRTPVSTVEGPFPLFCGMTDPSR